MKVILNNDVLNLGEEGDVKEVARGYARNFLIPKQLAVPYNKQTLSMFESKRAQIEKRKQEKLRLAQGVRQRIETEVVNLTMPAGDQGKLFGSVTSTTLADELEKRGIVVERKKIEIPDHTIKSAGSYKVRIRLYGSEEATLRVNVNQNPDEKTAARAAGGETTNAEEAAASGENAPAPTAEPTARAKDKPAAARPNTPEAVEAQVADALSADDSDSAADGSPADGESPDNETRGESGE